MDEYEVEIVPLPPQLVATMRVEAEPHELSGHVEAALTDVWSHLESHGSGPAGPPFSLLHHLTLDAEIPAPGRWRVEAGFPILERVPPGPGIRIHELPGGNVATTLHVGDYGGLLNAYLLLQSWMLAQELESGGVPWEVYLTDPAQEPDPEDWQTQLHWPLAGA